MITAMFTAIPVGLQVASLACALICQDGAPKPTPAPQAAVPPPTLPSPLAPKDEASPVVRRVVFPGADAIPSFHLVAASKDGHRKEFAPLDRDTAFELWIEGFPPQKSTVEQDDPDHPGQKRVVEVTQVPVAPISVAEFDEYTAYVRTIAPIGDEGMFMANTVAELMEQRAVQLFYFDAMDGVRKRLQAAIDKLNRGVPFATVVKQNSEDDTSKQAGGLFANDVHGSYLARYPFERAMFEVDAGTVYGPIFDKYAAYLLLCDEKHPSDVDHRRDRVQTRAICVRYTTAGVIGGNERGRLLASMRVRGDQERFLRVLPPAQQVPPRTKFGPDDIAPIGSPDRPLKQRSADAERDDRPVVLPKPAPAPAGGGGGR